MFNYKGFTIKMTETHNFTTDSFTVTPITGLVYVAESTAGKTFASNPQNALDDMHYLIDTYLETK